MISFSNWAAGISATFAVQMPAGERRIWLRLLAPDDAADVIQLADEDEREASSNYLDPVAQREVTALLAYKEDEAGGLMSPRFARIRPDMTVDEAISYLRRQARANRNDLLRVRPGRRAASAGRRQLPSAVLRRSGRRCAM